MKRSTEQHGGGSGPGWSSRADAVVDQMENLTHVARRVCNLTHVVGRRAGNPARVARRLLVVTLLMISTRAAGDPLEDLGEALRRGSVPGQTAPSMALTAPAEAGANEQAGPSMGSEPKTLRHGSKGPKNGQRSAMRSGSGRHRGPFGTRVDSPEGHSVPWYRSVLGSLGIVLVVMGAVYWFLKRWLPGTRLSESCVLHVVARTSLSPKHGVALVRLGRRFVMIGTSPDSVTVLSEITDPEEVADLAARTGLGAGRGRTGFDDLLSREATGYRKQDRVVKDQPRFGKAGASRQPPDAKGLTDLLDRLRTLRST